jgi:hypothetical protein
MVTKEYDPRVLSEGDLVKELDKLWADLQKPDSALSRQAAEQEVPFEALSGLKREDVIEVKTEGSGIGFLETVLVVVLGPLAMKAAEKLSEKMVEALWTRVIVPKILERKGDDALKEKEGEASDGKD